MGRRSRGVGIGAALVGVVVVAGGLLVWRDAQAAQAALVDARTALQAGERALGDDQDDDAAAAAFADAEADAARAQARLDGPGWTVVGWLPRIGGSVTVARSAADLAGASARLGAAVTAQADELLDGAALDGVLADGRIDLARLDELADTLDTLPVDEVQAARDRLVAVPAGQVLSSLLDERQAAVAQVDALLERLDRVSTGFDAMRNFLGADGPRTYLVAAQNPAELRGTGGLIGYLTELSLRDGEISLTAGVSVDAEEEVARRTDLDSLEQLPDPVDRPAAYADRYDHIAAGQFFGSVNAEPDLPTAAPVLLDLYAQEVGADLDGVILVDPVALGMIVQATGQPLQLPANLPTAGLPHEVPGNRLAQLVMVDGYDAFGGGGPDKKAFDRAVITAGFQRLTAGGWDPVVMAHTLGDVFATRHMQLYSRDEQEQAAFEMLGLAGQMTSTEGVGDVLAVTGNNAAANKTDVHVAHRISGRLELGAVRDTAPGRALRTGTLEVALDNPLRPGDHDDYITGSTEPLHIGGEPSPRVDQALNRTWFSVWTRPTTEVRELREGGQQQMFRATNIHGHRVFDYFLETPSASTNAFEIDLEGWVELARDGDAMVYELALWRQAKAIPDHWDLTIGAPPGWVVADASVTGGGAPTGTGVGGDGGEPIAASVEDGYARVRGAVTRDATVTVRLQRD